MLDGSKSSIEISIHALLAESDFYDYLDLCVKYNIFLSTLSLRRATIKERIKMKKLYFISIHALLAESD